METRELRIGNYVYDRHSKEIEKISSMWLTYQDYWINYDDKKCLKPIPLTEEWLLKFGAEKKIYEDDVNDYYCVIRHKKFDITYEDNNNIYCDIVGEIFMLKYVHQLQNLYFALTSEELTIKQTC